MDLLRDESFTLKEGEPDFRLIMHTLDNQYYTTRKYIGYRLMHGAVELFAGSDFKPSPLHGRDADLTLLTLLSYLCLRKGGVDAEYFNGYTDTQLQFRDQFADDLMLMAAERFPEAARQMGYDVEDEENPESIAA